jgi:hypothetical protein
MTRRVGKSINGSRKLISSQLNVKQVAGHKACKNYFYPLNLANFLVFHPWLKNAGRKLVREFDQEL